ncbi:hypothetical protein [Cereibacter azotoformans]|uniref:hypothetical protein n=1 Tax=Cereibacter azotoformans TaxID=43057 RepID=UPI000C6DE216|nr:hypothetical protein [Cereibacter azotoformans]
MNILVPASAALLLLAACDPVREAASPAPSPMARPAAGGGALGGQGVAPASLDRTTEAERRAALAPAAAGRPLGTVTAGLGAPTEPGFWLRSALVAAEQPGRVELEGGRSVAVTLRPGSGAAQLSLPAFRALGLGLTDLPLVTVHGG